jgi:aminoglycoside 3-N-acetyltransferase
MSLKDLVKRVLPATTLDAIGRARQKSRQARVSSLPLLSETSFKKILVSELGLAEGDTVFVHSSIDQLNLGFPFYRVLPLLQEVTGRRGTLLFPTYPRLSSYESLSRGEIFDVRKTPSYTGILTEFARRQPRALRSFHPTKSVCAIGPRAQELTNAHQMSPYPYDARSPYYKIIEAEGKIVGIGVSTANLSFVHCVDDALKDDFPVQPYHPQLFVARCINYDGQIETVETYAHDLRNMNHNIPRYMKRHISAQACLDLDIDGMQFFRADAGKLFEAMLQLARNGRTIYARSAYSRKVAER